PQYPEGMDLHHHGCSVVKVHCSLNQAPNPSLWISRQRVAVPLHNQIHTNLLFSSSVRVVRVSF
ncbi:MAG TPA: hypothetical protein V6D48_15420, partial [Oculatellaceae cyanobacterium]